MKLSFTKQSDGEITVCFRGDDHDEEFSYSKMVRKIYKEKRIDDAEINGEFSDIEKESIGLLIEELRSAVIDSEDTEAPDAGGYF